MAYVNNTELLDALLESHMAGKLTDKCHEILSDIVRQRIKAMLVYDKQQHNEPLFAFCMEKLYKVWQKFSFKEENPFAYFYTIVDNRIKQYFAIYCPVDEHGKPLVTIVSIDAAEARLNDS